MSFKEFYTRPKLTKEEGRILLSGEWLREYIYESPQMVNPRIGEFDTKKGNKDFFRNLNIIQPNPRILVEYSTTELLLYGDLKSQGWIVLTQKSRETILFISIFEEVSFGRFGKGFFQKTVWSSKAPEAKGIPKKVFEFYLNIYPKNFSDKGQTEAGKRFWIERMRESSKNGYKVGLMDLGEDSPYNWFDPSKGTFDQWISGTNGWGNTSRFTKKRFTIWRK